jgi:hypothetical protein
MTMVSDISTASSVLVSLPATAIKKLSLLFVIVDIPRDATRLHVIC